MRSGQNDLRAGISHDFLPTPAPPSWQFGRASLLDVPDVARTNFLRLNDISPKQNYSNYKARNVSHELYSPTEPRRAHAIRSNSCEANENQLDRTVRCDSNCSTSNFKTHFDSIAKGGSEIPLLELSLKRDCPSKSYFHTQSLWREL